MKIIKKGSPYRKHKCSKCKTKYAYHIGEDVSWGNLHCPICNNYLDIIIFDRRISEKEYNNLKK